MAGHDAKDFIKKYQVSTKGRFSLASIDPDDKPASLDKKQTELLLVEEHKKLKSLQNLLFAEGKHAVLVVLQAMDTGGKDGTIRRVFGPFNPQGVRVHSFKAPNPKEMQHDYLWRIHPCIPKRGMITIFNRSHYEDVLITRVHNLVSEKIIKQRYEEINQFEEYLTNNGVTILKFFIHISKDEQKRRLEERRDNPDKHWKFSSADLKERCRWDDYQDTFERMLKKCSKPHAPWYVIPGNAKWYRNIVIARILRHTFEKLDMRFPAAEEGLQGLVIPD